MKVITKAELPLCGTGYRSEVLMRRVEELEEFYHSGADYAILTIFNKSNTMERKQKCYSESQAYERAKRHIYSDRANSLELRQWAWGLEFYARKDRDTDEYNVYCAHYIQETYPEWMC